VKQPNRVAAGGPYGAAAEGGVRFFSCLPCNPKVVEARGFRLRRRRRTPVQRARRGPVGQSKLTVIRFPSRLWPQPARRPTKRGPVKPGRLGAPRARPASVWVPGACVRTTVPEGTRAYRPGLAEKSDASEPREQTLPDMEGYRESRIKATREWEPSPPAPLPGVEGSKMSGTSPLSPWERGVGGEGAKQWTGKS